ncbi:MAG: hypothetical protein AAF587_43735 [Bacteroidota bacterium]
MIADLDTRKGAALQDVNQDSQWFNGLSWMTDDISKFPIKSIQEIKLSNEEVRLAKAEQISMDIDPTMVPSSHFTINMEKTTEVYNISQYVIDPNKFQWNKVIRILGYVLRFLRNIKIRLKFKVSTDAFNPIKEAE